MIGDINVAYDGTVADLGSNTLAFTWDELCASHDQLSQNMFSPIHDIDDTCVPCTVSPKDVYTDSMSSVPASAALTNLTTPGSSYLDTPDDQYETSPLFDSLDAPEPWSSLFAHEQVVVAEKNNDTIRTNSISGAVVIHPGGVSRKRSSTNVTPPTRTKRAISGASVTKHEKSLAPIVVDPSDSVAVKRARNTAAARKSRDKKFKEVEHFKARITELEQEVEHWKAVALSRDSD